jgi:MobA/MobL family
MPIAFIKVRFLNVLRGGGACKVVAYLGRKAILDERLEMTFDYREVADDLVYEDLMLPDGAPFATAAELANALDEAERRRQRRATKRKRWPQIGAHFIFALPSDSVVTLDEAVEMAERLVRFIMRGSSSLPVLIVIHDPALGEPGSEARHAHIFVGLREVEASGLSRKKIRGLFAQARRAAQPNVHSAYVAEGVSWPDTARDLQTMFFAEICSGEVVDPIAPLGGRHWSAKTRRESPERRALHDDMVERRNIELINGAPAELIRRLLRGRSVMRIDEVRRLLARFLDGADDRENRLNAIITDPAIVTYAAKPNDQRPHWLSCSAIDDVTREAVALVDRAAADRHDPTLSEPPRLAVAVGDSESAVFEKLKAQILNCVPPIHRPLILGRANSESHGLAAGLRDAHAVVGLFAALRDAPLRSRHGGRRKKIGIRRGGLVVVPHAELVGDQDLADLLLRAEKCSARVMLGYDPRRASPSCRLAAHLADTLGDCIPSAIEKAARDLRAGLVHRACHGLNQHGTLRFEPADEPTRAAAGFVVCNDVGRLAVVDRALQEARSSYRNAGPRFTIETPKGPLVLQSGQWIVYTASDYATGDIRAGRFAKVLASVASGTLDVVHPGRSNAAINLLQFPHVRSAYAISIREARHAPKDARLLIEVSTPDFAWSTALLAAERGENAVIRVDPSVARDLNGWIAAVRRSMPAPLIPDLTPHTDAEAELNLLMQKIDRAAPAAKLKVEKPPAVEEPLEECFELMSDIARGTSEETRVALASASNAPLSITTSEVSAEQAIPTNHQPAILSKAQRERLHEDLRAVLRWNSDTKLALPRLQSALAPTNEQRNAIAENLLQACPRNGPMAALVQVLRDHQERREADTFDDLELPAELTKRMPRAWGLWELYQFKTDLRSMAYANADWPMPLGPVGHLPDPTWRRSSEPAPLPTWDSASFVPI